MDNEEKPLNPPPKKPRTAHLVEAEKELIRNNFLTMSDRELSAEIGCNENTIYVYRKKMGLMKRGMAKKLDVKIRNLATEIESEVEENKGDLSKVSPDLSKEYLKVQLKTSNYYNTLRDQFTKEELSYYVEAWADLGHQFSDIYSTEKRQIDEYIKTEIYGNRILKSLKIAHDEVEMLAKQIEEWRKDPKFEDEDKMQERDDLYMMFVQRLNAACVAMQNDYARNVELRRRITEDLNARRRDRTEEIKKVGSTFLSLIEAFKEEEVRKAQGRHMEILRLAREKKLGVWRKPNLFPDGSRDCIILDSQSEIVKNLGNVDLLENPQPIDKRIEQIEVTEEKMKEGDSDATNS